jgi:hypothetical protein
LRYRVLRFRVQGFGLRIFLFLVVFVVIITLAHLEV